MRTKLLRVGVVLTLAFLVVAVTSFHGRRRLARLVREFEEYSGTRLVFDRGELPPGEYHDIMVTLPDARKAKAAEICLQEAQKYPPGYLGRSGLKTLGVFAACASKRGDGFRRYDAKLGGYRYYGAWNQADACVAAYYYDHQLRLTFHHEIFHHLDAACARRSGTDRDVDRRYREALAGKAPYPSPSIRPADLVALKRLSQGEILEDSVSDYAEKTIGEDQAETSRYFLTTLADGLVQIVERPDLPGSQRILACLEKYRLAVKDGPGVDWFVDVALGRIVARGQ